MVIGRPSSTPLQGERPRNSDGHVELVETSLEENDATVRDYFVYILTNKSREVFYTGVTNNLRRRMFEHAEEHVGFAGRYNLKLLVHVEPFSDAQAAIAREKQIKGWRRSKKIALITRSNPHWDDLAEGY